jgi:plastocyanin
LFDELATARSVIRIAPAGEWFPVRIKLRALVAPLIAGLVVLVAALILGGGSSQPPTDKVVAGRSASIVIGSFMFHPMNLTVRAGTTITVTNDDDIEHTATAIGGAFDTGALTQGKSARFTLDKPGTYQYACSFHAFMRGVITVVA